jgi:hypothetical protein
MPWTQTVLGVVDKGMGLRLAPLADYQTHHEFAVSRHCHVIPHIPSHLRLVVLALFLLFFTQLHGSSNSRAFSMMPCTR